MTMTKKKATKMMKLKVKKKKIAKKKTIQYVLQKETQMKIKQLNQMNQLIKKNVYELKFYSKSKH